MLLDINNRLILNWGVKNGGSMDGYTTITFPHSYKTTCLIFLTPTLNNNGDWTTNNDTVLYKYYHNGSLSGTITLTNFTIGNFYTKHWLAIGY